MSKREKIKELFGSLSEDSDSPASPPPGAWPPPVDPGRRYRVPRVGTSVQRGDSSRDRHTSWMGEPPPATPRPAPGSRGQATATTSRGEPAGKKAARTAAATKMAAPGSAVTTRPATGGPGKTARERPPQDRLPASSGSGDKAQYGGTTSRTAIANAEGSLPTNPTGSSTEARGQKMARGQRAKALPPMPPGLKRGSTSRRGPTIRAVQMVQPPGAEIKTVASILTAGKPIVTATSTAFRQADARAAASTMADDATAATVPGGREDTVAGPASAPVMAYPPPPAVTSTPGTVPVILPPPAPPAYIRQEGWISRPGILLAVPIQLPDGTCISAPMSAIRHNRKWRARTTTGRWILRFAADGRLTMCRRVQEAPTG
ncbi:hypothetical protein PUN28_003746 [Cardiocondyla obscurior]|uniref:Translation initiation factor IF-2 n=1 Tax=Cardiocondyla obscurior TaxID=286306 RepID=A0AAW2GMW7_9HYME